MTLKKQSRPIIRTFGKLYYLINHEYRLLQKQILIICLLEFVIGQVLFIATLAPYNREEKLLFAPFEQVVVQSGQSLLTIISVGFTLLFIGLGVHQQFTPGRSIYRLYQLESSPAILYGAKLIAAATGLMLVLLTQLASAIAAWFLYYQSAAADLIPGSLQLAFLRSGHLLLLAPVDAWHVTFQAVLLILAAAWVVSSVLELHKPGQSAFSGLALMAAVLLATAVLLRMVYGSLDEFKPAARVFQLLLAAALCGLVMLRGHHLLAERTAC